MSQPQLCKLEIGGGNRNRGDGFINMDMLDDPAVDVKHDLNKTPWPFADDSVDEIYSSHCIEHVDCSIRFLREVVRIGKVGAPVEIRCPDAFSEMAMVAGHKAVIPINVARHWDHIFPDLFWQGMNKMLRLDRIEPGADDYWFPMARASRLFHHWSDDDILTWLPRTRHENRFYCHVAPYPRQD